MASVLIIIFMVLEQLQTLHFLKVTKTIKSESVLTSITQEQETLKTMVDALCGVLILNQTVGYNKKVGTALLLSLFF